MTTKVATVYGLYATDGRIKYVGSTALSTEQRLRRHWKHAREGRDNDVQRWLREVGPDNVKIEELETAPLELKFKVEREWIRTLIESGHELLNIQDTPKFNQLFVGPKTEEHRRNIARARTGTKRSAETIEKMARARRGKPSTNDYSPLMCDGCGRIFKGAVGVTLHKTRKSCGSSNVKDTK